MKTRLCYNPALRTQTIRRTTLLCITLAAIVLLCNPAASGDEAPSWMRSLINATLPAHDEAVNAVLLYSEVDLTVLSSAKTRTTVRQAYKILRPGGRDYGTVMVPLRSYRKLNGLRAWCIPSQGKDYEVKEKESVETANLDVRNSELVTDFKVRILQIPASEPGSIVGYEYQVEEQPLVLQDDWAFQQEIPVRESQYSIQLPEGWTYTTTWLNYGAVAPAQTGSSRWQWTVRDVKAIPKEQDMPPIKGVAGGMIVSFFPKDGIQTFRNWQEVGNWFVELARSRQGSSAEIKDQVSRQVAGVLTPMDKMKTLANFVQHNMRYVAIELGLGGFQPHPAPEIFSHRYGDCKDLATLLKVMLREIGVESYYVLINHERGSVTPDTPPHLAFDHVILAIKIPEGVPDSSMFATIQHPKNGRLLFFDPTDELTPFGQIRGALQANYGVLVMPESNGLTLLPQQPSRMNGIRRTGRLRIDASGNLTGDIEELRVGDYAMFQRWALRTVTTDAARTKPIEQTLTSSFANFRITKAAVMNMQLTEQPFGFAYSFESANYAKRAGDLLLLRPRVLGSEARTLLETKEPRMFAIEFSGPRLDTDTFDISLPPGLEVEELPPATHIEYDFASYNSSTERRGDVIRYTRRFELKELSVPANRADELKKFYRVIAADERNTVILKSQNRD